MVAGLTFGLLGGVLLHDTNLVGKLFRRPLPPSFDPLRRLRGWTQAAEVVGTALEALRAEGKPAFVVGDHYGTTGLLSFYLPEAKAGVPDHPLVYCRSSAQPENQFFFWPGYGERHGQNALYVQQTSVPRPPPARLLGEFDSVTDLGLREVLYRGQVIRHLQLFACRQLR